MSTSACQRAHLHDLGQRSVEEGGAHSAHERSAVQGIETAMQAGEQSSMAATFVSHVDTPVCSW